MKDNINDSLENLSEAMSAALNEVFPADRLPGVLIEYEYIEIDTTAVDNARWREVMSEHIADATAFELHCWNDEEDAIELALHYGEVKPANWRNGVVIGGPVTAEFCKMLLSQPKPGPRLAGNAFTPFFTIRLNNGFESTHYGTELIKLR